MRPDAIIGFVPNSSTFNLAVYWATYLSAYALLEGTGSKAPYLRTTKGYKLLFNNTSAGIISRLVIYAFLNPKKCSSRKGDFLDTYGFYYNFDRQFKEDQRDRVCGGKKSAWELDGGV